MKRTEQVPLEKPEIISPVFNLNKARTTQKLDTGFYDGAPFPYPHTLFIVSTNRKWTTSDLVAQGEEATLHPVWLLETFRFEEDNNYEYKIFAILSIAGAWTGVILAGKRDSHGHSATKFIMNVVVAETSYQMLEVLSFFLIGRCLTSFNKDNSANFSGESKVLWSFLECILFFENTQ